MKIGFLKSKHIHIDPWLTSCVLLLTIIGLFVIYSATETEGVSAKVKVQLLATGIGIILCFVLMWADFRVIAPYRTWLYMGCIFLLVLVLFFGSGKEQTGANSWIRLGPVSLQPSEPAKVVFAFVFAGAIAEAKRKCQLHQLKEILKLFLAFGVICGLVVLQNDTGTALVFAFMFATMLFMGGLKLRYFGVAMGTILIAIPVIWYRLAPYQKNRILVFLRPETDPAGAGYQVLQSKLSVASGQLFGRGFMQGRNNRLSLLPEKETDFIFGVIGEEFGFFGCILVVGLLFFLCIRCFVIAQKAKDWDGKLLCIGIGAMFLFHVVENICMCIGLLPVTGIPLPFLSYGGSAQVTGYIAVGVLQNIYDTSKRLQFYEN